MKRLPEHERRVIVSARVRPVIRDTVDALAAQRKISRSDCIDLLLARSILPDEYEQVQRAISAQRSNSDGTDD